MDTDSAYMALSGSSLQSVIRPKMLETFFSEYKHWFPRPYCDKHEIDFKSSQLKDQEWEMTNCCKEVSMHDSRTPDLFKEEFQGDGIVALNSKTYFCWNNNNKVKLSSKGLSKSTNKLNRESYLTVLQTQKDVTGTNRGFVKKDQHMYTYEQLKTGLTYFYGKRIVCNDGVSTKNILL